MEENIQRIQSKLLRLNNDLKIKSGRDLRISVNELILEEYKRTNFPNTIFRNFKKDEQTQYIKMNEALEVKSICDSI